MFIQFKSILGFDKMPEINVFTTNFIYIIMTQNTLIIMTHIRTSGAEPGI